MRSASSASTPSPSKTTTGSNHGDGEGGIESGGGARAGGSRVSREYHDRFVAALERHGGGGGGGGRDAVVGRGAKRRSAWDDIAESVGGGATVKEVKLYAYRYMLHLQSASTRKKAKLFRSGSGQKGEFALLESLDKSPPPNASESPASSSYSDTWSYEDSVLFETLLARYGPEGAKGAEMGKKPDGDHQPDDDLNAEFRRWDRIASMIPGKTSIQVREQYRKRFGGGTSNVIAAAGSSTISTSKQQKEHQQVVGGKEGHAAATAASQGKNDRIAHTV